MVIGKSIDQSDRHQSKPLVLEDNVLPIPKDMNPYMDVRFYFWLPLNAIFGSLVSFLPDMFLKIAKLGNYF